MLSQKLWNGCWWLILDCTLWYTSCKLCWAPSLPEPIAFASNWTNVPDGSMWKSWGPFSSKPANKIATPNGRLCNQTSNMLTTQKWWRVEWKHLKCVCECVRGGSRPYCVQLQAEQVICMGRIRSTYCVWYIWQHSLHEVKQSTQIWLLYRKQA